MGELCIGEFIADPPPDGLGNHEPAVPQTRQMVREYLPADPNRTGFLDQGTE